MTQSSTRLTAEELRQYQERGYHFPIPVFSQAEIDRYRDKYFAHRERSRERLASLPGNRQYEVFSEAHYVAGWVYDMARHPKVLDAVEAILGPNLIAWNTSWFAKMPGEKTFVSWHQDGMYWKLTPSTVVTAWIALTPSRAFNGCMRVVPGTHLLPPMRHEETYNPDNALSRGQDIAAEVDESQAVNIELNPGEMSLHDIWIAHGSLANKSPDVPRVGMAIRYVATNVKQESPQPPVGMLVRGHDDFGYFDLQPPPTREDLLPDDPQQAAIVQKIRESVMPAAAR